MTYYAGFVQAVPTANKDAYAEHSRKAWPIFKRYGARRMVECWGEDVPHGKQTDFYRATKAKDDETPVFSWFEWPDRATCDKAWQSMMDDPEMQQMGEMPFDGMRMFWGGFTQVYHFGASAPGRYVQGFVLAVHEEKKDAYIRMASDTAEMFTRMGATFMTENWGTDVPHGKETDFYRAADAREGEVPLFSWIEWPDRATCDKAAAQMGEEMGDMDMSQMPFDGMRMFWGGFAPLVDES